MSKVHEGCRNRGEEERNLWKQVAEGKKEKTEVLLLDGGELTTGRNCKVRKTCWFWTGYHMKLPVS